MDLLKAASVSVASTGEKNEMCPTQHLVGVDSGITYKPVLHAVGYQHIQTSSLIVPNIQYIEYLYAPTLALSLTHTHKRLTIPTSFRSS